MATDRTKDIAGGLAVGVALGVAFGIALRNTAVGLALGILLGVVFFCWLVAKADQITKAFFSHQLIWPQRPCRGAQLGCGVTCRKKWATPSRDGPPNKSGAKRNHRAVI